MKLSNKILIGFFGLIFLYMIAAFTEIRFKGNLNRFNDSNSVSETVAISGIKYLVLSDLQQNITVLGSGKPGIEVKSVSGDVMQYLRYEQTGDTLTLLPLELKEEQNFRIYIHVPQSSFEGLTINNTSVTISGLEQDALNIAQTDGWLSVNKKNKIKKLNLTAQNNAYLKLSAEKLDTLSLNIDHSDINVYSRVSLVRGAMANEAFLNLHSTEEIQFRKDESSRLILN